MIIYFLQKDISRMGYRNDLKISGNLFESKMTDLNVLSS